MFQLAVLLAAQMPFRFGLPSGMRVNGAAAGPDARPHTPIARNPMAPVTTAPVMSPLSRCDMGPHHTTTETGPAYPVRGTEAITQFLIFDF